MFNSEISFFDAQPMFICEQATLKILDVNKAATDLLGHKKDYLTGKKMHQLGSKTNPDALGISSKARNRLSLEDIWVFTCKDGKDHYFQLSAHMIKFKGHPSKLIIAHNITGVILQNSDTDLLLSSQISFKNFPLAEIEWDSSFNIIRWSKKAEELFGYSSQEVVSKENIINEFIHKDDLDFVLHKVERTIAKKGKEFTVINRNLSKQGEIIYCEWYNSLLYDEDDNLVAVYSLTHDVTDREEALLETKRGMMSYQDLFNSISDSIYLLNKEGHIIEVNEGFVQSFGYKRSEVLGKHYKMLAVPEKNGNKHLDEIIKKANKGLNDKFEGWSKKKNGEIFPTEILVNTGNYFGGEILIIIERDISDRKKSEEALKKREGLFSRLFNSSPIGIALLNADRKVEMLNDGFEHLFGYREEELKGMDLDKVIVPENEKNEAVRLSESERVKQVTQKRIRKDGTVLDVIIYVVPVVVEQSVVGIYGIYVDITDRIKAENKVYESLREKEILLAEIHHRVKNNLAVITGLLELQSYSAESDSAKQILRESQMRVNSIAMVHEKLYKSENFSEINITQYFDELASVIHDTMRVKDKDIKILMDINDEIQLPVIQAIPCGLLLNEILTNSMKHAFKGLHAGLIEIKLRKENGTIYFQICDNGVGIPEDTKPDINSSLGMTLIKTLAKQLGADYSYDTKEGTCFRFSFEKKETELFDDSEKEMMAKTV